MSAFAGALVVSLAGGAGAVARAWFDGKVPVRHDFPRATTAVNLSGSLLVGIVVGFGAAVMAGAWQQVIAIGFLGGYTTFSTAAVQTAEMIISRAWTRALIYGLGTLVAAVGLAGVGMALGRWWGELLLP